MSSTQRSAEPDGQGRGFSFDSCELEKPCPAQRSHNPVQTAGPGGQHSAAGHHPHSTGKGRCPPPQQQIILIVL